MADVIQSAVKQNFNDRLTGIFAGPVIGLKYETPTISGFTNERGEFYYHPGEAVTFLLGRLVLGATKGAPRINLAQLNNRVGGNIDKLHDPSMTNLARLMQTLDEDGDVENGITIASAVHDIFGSRVIIFDHLPGMHGATVDGQDRFDNDPVVVDLLKELNAFPGVFTANTPRKLCTGAAARNALRRHIRGIIKMTDVKIPTRDGSLVR